MARGRPERTMRAGVTRRRKAAKMTAELLRQAFRAFGAGLRRRLVAY
jgi:hypothetical protein